MGTPRPPQVSSGPARPKSRLRTVVTRLALYGPLTVFALVTLVPFAYLVCSAVKPKSVFFSSPFLPKVGLFEIDDSTGMLSVVDVTHLPDRGPATYELTVALSRGGDPRGEKTVTVGYRVPADEADRYTFVIPDGAEPNTDLGGVRIGDATPPAGDDTAVPDVRDGTLPAPNAEAGAPPVSAPAGIEPAADRAERAAAEADAEGLIGADAEPKSYTVPPEYSIREGNRHGFLGRAWGMLTLENFKNLFRQRLPDGTESFSFFNNQGIGRAIINSFFFASVSSVLGVLGAAMGGYALSKFSFRGRGLIDWVVLSALVIPGAVLIAPGYQILYWLGLLDSYTGLILPGVAPAFGVFLFRQSMRNSVPTELIEAARIDGCGELRIFFTIALPMVRPMAGALLLFGFLGAWNNFLAPQIVLSTPEKYPLAVFISQLKGVYGTDYGLIMAGTLVAIAPILVLFLLLQKEFISGLTSGAVKG